MKDLTPNFHTELVEPGNVVEINTKNPELHRKARAPYSTRVAGVISTAPAITLGNAFDPQADKWEDSKPLLALAGRVPLKVTTENGSIKVGDFLTISLRPGYAMRCADLSQCTGAILGKVLESLGKGKGMIMVQATLDRSLGLFLEWGSGKERVQCLSLER